MKSHSILWFTAAIAPAAGDESIPEIPRDLRAEATFDSLDRNEDERLSKSETEIEGALYAQFGSVDKNRDGFLSKSEFVVHVTQNTTVDRK